MGWLGSTFKVLVTGSLRRFGVLPKRTGFAVVRVTLLLALSLFCQALPVRAMTINCTYDSSITSLPNAVLVEAAITYAAVTFQNQYTNPITVNITFYWGNTGPFASGISLGASQTQLRGYTYAQVVSGLTSRRSSTADFSSVASLPGTDPTGGSQWWVPRAEAKALGMSGLNANDLSLDGSVGFASGVNYTFDATNRAVAGKYDFIGVAQHEISEVLGRLYLLNDGITGYAPYDLFRFSALGTRNFTTSFSGVYFSVDNGATQLKMFFTNASMGDVQDWKSSASPDAFDAFCSSGHLLPMSAADITTLDILGYNSAPAPVATPPHLIYSMTNGALKISFTNTPGVTFTVVSSTNISLAVSNWTVLGAPTEGPAGQFQFTDPQLATNKVRYYRVRAP